MLHRHLSHQEFTLAAIDDVIARGKRRDWAELRRATLQDRAVLEKVLRVCLDEVKINYNRTGAATNASEMKGIYPDSAAARLSASPALTTLTRRRQRPRLFLRRFPRAAKKTRG